MSDMKLVICFMRRSTLDSLPVLRSVVIARVAILLFWSDIRLSRSTLQFVTAKGRVKATCNTKGVSRYGHNKLLKIGYEHRTIFLYIKALSTCMVYLIECTDSSKPKDRLG
jgi:hypothetical protein